MTSGHDGWAALPVRLRLIAHLVELAQRRAGVTVESMASKSLQERQQGKPNRAFCKPAPKHVSRADRSVPTRDGAVTVRTYRADGSSGDQPVLLYLHGGAWIMGGLDGVDPFCAQMAARAEVTVVSVDYRLAPEHRFPAGLNDAADVLAWLRKEGAEINVDGTRVAVAGDSAGGNLAAALCLLDRESASPIRLQVLLYPGLDATFSGSFMQTFRGPGLTLQDCKDIVALYVTSPEQASDPLVSPLLAQDLTGLPRALIVTGGADILADDGPRYAARLTDAGVEALHLHHPRAPHAFLGFDRLCPEADETVRATAMVLKAALA